jgi:hypothetical protein
MLVARKKKRITPAPEISTLEPSPLLSRPNRAYPKKQAGCDTMYITMPRITRVTVILHEPLLRHDMKRCGYTVEDVLTVMNAQTPSVLCPSAPSTNLCWIMYPLFHQTPE